MDYNKCFNNLFRGMLLIEIIFGIMGIFILPMNQLLLIVLVSIISISGVYTVSCLSLSVGLFNLIRKYIIFF